ncbi:MAG: hypothetical protein NC102_10475 [Clostridium sp.]|nr:hypothetical protein [Clostridium sp.]
MRHEHEHEGSRGMHVAMKITKLALKVASVAAAFCMVSEIHKVHQAIDRRK